MKKQLNAKIEQDVFAQFKERCASRSVKMSGKVEELIKKYLTEE